MKICCHESPQGKFQYITYAALLGGTSKVEVETAGTEWAISSLRTILKDGAVNGAESNWVGPRWFPLVGMKTGPSPKGHPLAPKLKSAHALGVSKWHIWHVLAIPQAH